LLKRERNNSLKSYLLKIGNLEYMVSGPGDMMSTPPSARGFSLKIFEKGTGRYATVYKAYEENGYGFLIYADDDKKLILKGGQGSDHKETIYARSEELKNIRKEKYSDQDDMNFLRKICLSGRAWLVNLNNQNYYFVGIWNTSITNQQYDALKEYLTKLPSNTTYIQMGMAGTGPSSEFQLLSGFSPKITSAIKPTKEKPNTLSKKERDFVTQAHAIKAKLPAGFAKELEKLRNMAEQDTFASNYHAYKKYESYALKMIAKLEKIKALGKAKTSARDIVTKSSVQSIIIGLGKQYPHLTKKLDSLLKYAYTHSDLVNLHKKGIIDAANWNDTSMVGVVNDEKKLTHQQWLDSQSTGLGDPKHPINHKNPDVNKLTAENAEMAQSDITKIVDYSEKLQSMFDVNDNLEDWVKAKLNHACDYVSTVRDYLKFYRDEKESGTPDDQINEKWSMKYKKSINCNNPKGFGQKAHCRARKLRQAGKHTKSKPVREIYREVTNQLLKEFNSSMAMGALKQINSDAQELQSMLQPNTKLEDWVKAKLNLAGEYLDDVYHHLDHFGPQGRKLDEGLNELDYEGSVGMHELINFYSKANPEEVKNMDFCIEKKNIPCVKELVKKVTGMTMVNINECCFDNLQLYHDIVASKRLEEGWKDLVAAGAIGLSALSNSPALAAKQDAKPAITQQATKPQSAVKSAITQQDTNPQSSEASLLNKKTSDYIGQWEGKRKSVYLDTENKPTIGIGHYLTNTQQDRDLFKSLFGNSVNYDAVLKGKQKLTDDQIERLFNVDVKVKERLANNKINNFSSLPQYVKNAIINAFYRGDIGPKTIKLMNVGNWNMVAKEYLNHQNARSGPDQIQRRMKTNALAFTQYAKNKN